MRLEGTVKKDLRRDAKVAMMDENTAELSSLYSVDERPFQVSCKLKN